jgi:gamma-glutamyl-gamma-aminobutyrate hydrolase PuuD
LRIAISMRIENAVGYDEPRDAISHDWIRWLVEHGHLPLPVPNALGTDSDYLAAVEADALVLTGGNDVVPEAEDRPASELRNAAEARLLDKAMARGLPVLGVCRGLHVINIHFGGEIDRDITGGALDHVAHEHDVSLAPVFETVADTSRIVTNSYHRQGVTDDRIGAGLVPFAWSEPDRKVEGLYHRDRPILAVQWHPERPNPAAAFDDAVIGRLFDAGAFWRT